MRFRESSANIEGIDIREFLLPKRADLDELCPALLKLLKILRVVELEGRVADDADADTTIDQVDADLPLVLVIGAEGAGLSRLVRDGCDVVAGIPISGGTESLNASVAAGIGLYALAQGRSTP